MSTPFVLAADAVVPVAMSTRERLFGYQHAFDHPITAAIAVGIAAILVLSAIAIAVVSRRTTDDKLRKELWSRYRSWLVIIPLIAVPVLLGAFWTILAIGLLSLACYSEYARATGFFREKSLTLIVTLGILATYFAVMDHWYAMFVAMPPLTITLLAATAILRDEPKGYIQRVGLGVLGYMLMGLSLAHLAYVANDAVYRPMILSLVLCVQINDVFAFTCGKTFGRRKLAPNTSPGKTLGGALGAIVLTCALVAVLAHFGLRGTPLDHPIHAVALGLIISIGGILGDLTLSSIKRDIGIKDMGALIPGHGGVLDRCNSLLLVAPLAFHYVGAFRGIGLNQPTRIMTGD